MTRDTRIHRRLMARRMRPLPRRDVRRAARKAANHVHRQTGMLISWLMSSKTEQSESGSLRRVKVAFPHKLRDWEPGRRQESFTGVSNMCNLVSRRGLVKSFITCKMVYDLWGRKYHVNTRYRRSGQVDIFAVEENHISD